MEGMKQSESNEGTIYLKHRAYTHFLSHKITGCWNPLTTSFPLPTPASTNPGCCNLKIKKLPNAFISSKAENDYKFGEQSPAPLVYVFVSLCHLGMSHVSTCLAPFCNCLPLVQWTQFPRQKLPSDVGWGWVPHSCSSPIIRARPSLWGPWVMQDGLCGQDR